MSTLDLYTVTNTLKVIWDRYVGIRPINSK